MKAEHEGLLLVGAMLTAIVVCGVPHRIDPPQQVHALSFAAPSTSLTVVLHSTDGSVLSCPASSVTFNADLLEVNGFACPVDSIFHNGFEVQS